MRTLPDLCLEQALALPRIAGVDEVGRGPIAGPVTAAAVVLDPARIPAGLNDSKRLSPARRDALATALEACAEIAIVHVDVDEIDHHNILRASLLAMQRAVARLHPAPQAVLVDGPHLPPGLPCPGQAVIGGDARSLSIAAASIVAKVARDRLMQQLDAQFPGYGWARNAGYPTAEHRAALHHLGVSPHHRRSFAPIRKMLCG